MPIYRLEARGVRNQKELLDALLHAGRKYSVLAAGSDPVFLAKYVTIIQGTHNQACDVRRIVWNYNAGNECSMREITEDEFVHTFG